MEKKSKEKLFTIPFFMLVIATVMVSINNTVLQQVIPLYITDKGYSTAVVGVITMFYVYGAMVVRPFLGRLADVKGRKTMLFICCTAVILCCISYTFALPLIAFGIIRTLQGVFNAGIQTGKNALVGDVVPKDRMAEGIGYMGVISQFVSGYAPALAVFMINGLGYITTFWGAALAIGIMIMSIVFIREDKKQYQELKKIKPTESTEKSETASSAKPGFHLSNYLVPEAMIPSILSAFMIFAVVGYGTYNVMILKERNIENFAWALSIVPYVNIVVRLALGQIVKKIGEGYTIFIGCVSMIIGMVLLFLAGNLTVLTIALVFYNIGYQLGYSTINALVMKRSKSSNRGASTATWMIMMDVGQGIGAAIWGVVAGMFAMGPSVVYLCLAGVFVICALISFFVLIPDCKKWEAKRAAALAAGEDLD